MVFDLPCGQIHHLVEIADVGDHLTASRPFIDLSAGAVVACVMEVNAEHPAVNLAFVGIDHTIAVIITPDIDRTVPLAQGQVFSAVQIRL